MSHLNVASCTVAFPRESNHATQVTNNATDIATTYATVDLKALANKVLLRNQQGNFAATDQKIPCNFNDNLCHEKLQPYYGTFSLRELKEWAGEDWREIRNNSAMLKAFADALRQSLLLKKGIVPKHYTQSVICANCGEVKLWQSCPKYVLGCAWCFIKKEK